jgi:hypothetical protein
MSYRPRFVPYIGTFTLGNTLVMPALINSDVPSAQAWIIEMVKDYKNNCNCAKEFNFTANFV